MLPDIPTGWAGAISVVGMLIMVILQAVTALRQQKAREDIKDDLQKGRQDIQDGNADAVSSRIDELLTSAEGNDPGGEPDREVTAERISAVLGVAPDGFSPGTAAGAGGKKPGDL